MGKTDFRQILVPSDDRFVRKLSVVASYWEAKFKGVKHMAKGKTSTDGLRTFGVIVRNSDHHIRTLMVSAGKKDHEGRIFRFIAENKDHKHFFGGAYLAWMGFCLSGRRFGLLRRKTITREAVSGSMRGMRRESRKTMPFLTSLSSDAIVF